MHLLLIDANETDFVEAFNRFGTLGYVTYVEHGAEIDDGSGHILVVEVGGEGVLVCVACRVVGLGAGPTYAGYRGKHHEKVEGGWETGVEVAGAGDLGTGGGDVLAVCHAFESRVLMKQWSVYDTERKSEKGNMRYGPPRGP